MRTACRYIFPLEQWKECYIGQIPNYRVIKNIWQKGSSVEIIAFTVSVNMLLHGSVHSICRAIIEECTELMHYSIWPKELRIADWQWLQWDWLCSVASLLRAADMKLFARLSCQGFILCKWIEQLMLTSLNKTTIQILKPYSSRSLSLFSVLPLISCSLVPEHESTRLNFFIVPHTFVLAYYLSHTVMLRSSKCLCPISLFLLWPCRAPAEWLLTSHLLLPVTEFEKWASEGSPPK